MLSPLEPWSQPVRGQAILWSELLITKPPSPFTGVHLTFPRFRGCQILGGQHGQDSNSCGGVCSASHARWPVPRTAFLPGAGKPWVGLSPGRQLPAATGTVLSCTDLYCCERRLCWRWLPVACLSFRPQGCKAAGVSEWC